MSARRRLPALLALLAFVDGALLVSPRWARAQAAPVAPAGQATELLQKGLAAFDDLDYAATVDLLHRAVEKGLSKDDQIKAWDTMAFAYVALGEEDAAESAFQRALEIDPAHRLPDGTSPKIQAVFERAAHPPAPEAPPAPPPPPPKPLEPVVLYATVKPHEGVAGEPLHLSATTHDPSGRMVVLRFFYRARRGAGGAYRSLEVAHAGVGAFAADLPGDEVQEPGIDCYFVGEDDAGRTVAASGSEGEPMLVAVRGRKKTAFYATWWFWTAVSAVVGGAIVTGVVLGTRAGADTTPAPVTIVPH